MLNELFTFSSEKVRSEAKVLNAENIVKIRNKTQKAIARIWKKREKDNVRCRGGITV